MAHQGPRPAWTFSFIVLLTVSPILGKLIPCRRPCSREYRPVCGTDGQTYANVCEFKNGQCRTPGVEIQYGGQCGKPDPNHPASRPAEVTTQKPASNCRRQCPETPDHVCGSDGVTYTTLCHLMNANCGITATYIYMVTHKACQDHTPATSVAHAIDNLKSCRRLCTLNYTPVCASNGVSYGNRCQYEEANCRLDNTLSLVAHGRCEDTAAPQAVGAVSLTSCSDVVCTSDFAPVCASSGHTYPNECAFNKENCRIGHLLTIAHAGRCDQGPVPLASANIATSISVCPEICTAEYSPVCASNGQTYSNECEFRSVNCRMAASLILVHMGHCASSGEIPPADQLADRVAPSSLASGTSPCDRPCPRNFLPICGTDGVTYDNLCVFEIAMCKARGSEIRLLHQGPCAEPNDANKFPPPSGDVSGVLPAVSCARPCPANYLPVCGTDGRTYGNLCSFEAAQCINASLQLVHQGACSLASLVAAPQMTAPAVADPMEDCLRPCQFNYDPICANDDTTYGNLCQFEAAKCMRHNLTIVHRGRCQPPGAAELHGKARCVRPCFQNYQPVCGTDDRTYGNLCHLEIAMCKNQSIKLSRHGICGQPPAVNPALVAPAAVLEPKMAPKSPQAPFTESKMATMVAATPREKQINPHCMRPCQLNYDPVCGTNGISYANVCTLQAAQCQDNTIQLHYKGPCADAVPASVSVTGGQQGGPKAECPSVCPYNYAPVCASDENTYPNLCSFNAENCKRGGALTLVHEGPCPDKARRLEDPSKPCRRKCERKLDPICGSDGRTYPNECIFQGFSCRQGYNIRIRHRGACIGDSLTTASSMARRRRDVGDVTDPCDRGCGPDQDPVCGSDDVTYANKCLFQEAQCRTDGDISIVNYGECEEDPSNLFSSKNAQLDCPTICHLNYLPVCGSDGITYPNKCAFSAANCRADGRLTATRGECSSQSPLAARRR